MTSPCGSSRPKRTGGLLPGGGAGQLFRTAGPAGAWLWELFHGLDVPDFVKFGPLWCLGDSAPLVVTGLDDATSTFTEKSTQSERRTYTSVDTRLIMADFAAKLRLQA